METVAAFTDTYLPTVNGVTYTVKAWRDEWRRRGGRMDVVYPRADGHRPGAGEHPVRSLPFPFYDGFRLGLPQVPAAVRNAEVVHAHTPFGLGVGGLRLARATGAPLVVSYHTPTAEYAGYLAPAAPLAATVERLAGAYERWFLGRVDAVTVPSEATRRRLEAAGVDAPVHVVPNGVDTGQFRPVDPAGFRAAHGLDGDRPLVGYTGRHGHEKCLGDIIDAAEGLDVTVVFGGDGPARPELEARAAAADADVRFLGFLDRDDLPAFYSALDVFAFPSPVETQGLVALEANACGTPVVGVDAGALADTIDEGETGHRFPPGDVDAFRAAIERALDDPGLRESCLERRGVLGVDRAVDELAAVYAAVS